MKTEWQFPFDVSGFRFDVERRFLGDLKEFKTPSGDLIDLQFEVKISIEESKPSPGFDQSGLISIVLPFREEQADMMAHQIAHLVAERLSFTGGGHFKVHGGFFICKRIPETSEEEQEVGDTPYSMKVSLVEAIEPPPFNADALSVTSARPTNFPLLIQYNAACREKNLISQFLGLFRVIESVVTFANPKLTLKKAMEANERLRTAYEKNFGENSFVEFVDRAVGARHQCAHLKLGQNFGYLPKDPRLESEVRPLINPLQTLARLCVEDP